MATFYLLNSIRVGTAFHWAGSLLDDTVDDTTGVAAAGGQLVASSVTGMSAASAIALGVKARGGTPDEATSIMKAAYDTYQTNTEASHDSVSTDATGVTNNNESTHTHAVASDTTGISSDTTRQMKCRDFAPTSLPAATVTIHAQDAGGGALALAAGFTNPLPRRSMVITRGAGGPASVDYTCEFVRPDGTTNSEVVAVVPSGTGETVNAAEWTGVSTTVDPVSTTDFETGDGFSVGEVMDATAVPILAADSVVESVVSNVLASGTIFPTTSPDGLKAFTVQYLAGHAHGVTDAGHDHGGATGAGAAHTHTVTDAGHTHTLS